MHILNVKLLIEIIEIFFCSSANPHKILLFKKRREGDDNISKFNQCEQKKDTILDFSHLYKRGEKKYLQRKNCQEYEKKFEGMEETSIHLKRRKKDDDAIKYEKIEKFLINVEP